MFHIQNEITNIAIQLWNIRNIKMEKTIWKFQIKPNDIIKIDMPIGAEVLTVQTQYEQPCVWALVDPKAKTETKTFAEIAIARQPGAVGVQQRVINTMADVVGKENIFVLKPIDPLPAIELEQKWKAKCKEKNWLPTRY